MNPPDYICFWPKAVTGVEWRVAGMPPNAAAELEWGSEAAIDPKQPLII